MDCVFVRPLMQLRDELLPEAPPSEVVSLVQDLPPESCVICIGHEPQLGMAASVLLSGQASASFPPEEIRGLSDRAIDSGEARRGVLRWWLTPGQLRAIGKRG